MKIIGHRGAKGLAPENTLSSFSKALAHNVDEIEFDVRVTKDGVPIMEHGSKMHNQAGDSLRVRDSTYAELLKHKPDLPTLAQAIQSVNRAVPLYVEVKPKEPTAPVIACIETFLHNGWQPSDFRFGSYDYKVLRELHAALPEVPLIIIESWSGVRATYRARKLGTRMISMNQRWLWSGYIRATKRGGYKLYAYTLDDPKKAQRWQSYGLYAAITDYPDLYQAK